MRVNILEHDFHPVQITLVAGRLPCQRLLFFFQQHQEKAAHALPDHELIPRGLLPDRIDALQQAVDHPDPPHRVGAQMDHRQAPGMEDGREILPVQITAEFSRQELRVKCIGIVVDRL